MIIKLQRDHGRRRLAFAVGFVLVGWLLVVAAVHEPLPRIHDEFSYVLMGEAIAQGHASAPGPPYPEFFESFHVLVRPVHASKYFPAQGLFLALGEKLTGHPAAGLCLSSALACAATVWMLEAWVGPGWSLLGGILMALQYGIFSYWSQSYWGGMAPALGGALFFGAIRRLWDNFTWRNSILLALSLGLLANSRPLEGFLTAMPATVLFMRQVWRNRRWSETGFWPKLILPSFVILAFGAFLTGVYNKAITSSAWKTPYILHEQQYQESPPFIFMPPRPKITYSSPWVQYYYEVHEMGSYLHQRSPSAWIAVVGRKLGTWWSFYCGVFLSVPLALPGILRRRTRYWQVVALALMIPLAISTDQADTALRLLLDVIVLTQVVLWWFVFDSYWERLALGTGSLLMLQLLFAKWAFPHYFAPAACLVLYLQVKGLRYIWNWSPGVEPAIDPISRQQRRRLEREGKNHGLATPSLRVLVYVVPAALAISLVVRVYGRLSGWQADPHSPERHALLMHDWSLRRAELDKWMGQQAAPQLVFVRYSRRHNVNFEWVYNHADIMHSHVIWARDLGAEHNKELLKVLPDRTVWFLEADKREPQLVPYTEMHPSDPELPLGMQREAGAEDESGAAN